MTDAFEPCFKNIWVSDFPLCLENGQTVALQTVTWNSPEQKRPGAKGLPEFAPESPLQKRGLWESYFLQGIRGKRHSQNLRILRETLWGPLARPALFVYCRTEDSEE